MGDHRASIKIEMEFHGVKDSCDMWINYYPTGCCDVDERVTEFFKRIYNQGITKYEEMVCASEKEEHDRNEKANELAELARLKAKYEAQT